VSWINEVGGTATGCGNLESSEAMDEAAFYCPRDKVMYYDFAFMRAVDATYGWMGVEAVMDHEEGHHIQKLLGLRFANLRDQELQADCLSGTFMRWISTTPSMKGQVTLTNMQKLFAELGNPVSSPDNHGDAYDRTQAFGNGWSKGVDACVPYPAS